MRGRKERDKIDHLPPTTHSQIQEMDQNDLESLLASLRQQQDPSSAPETTPAPFPSHHSTSASAPSQADLDALLNTLTALPNATDSTAATSSRSRDVSNLTFPESLPILHSLATDQAFLDSIEAMWDDQKNWELRMKDERNRLESEATRAGLS